MPKYHFGTAEYFFNKRSQHMGKILTAKELSELLQLKESSTFNLYEKIQEMMERVIKDWLEKRDIAYKNEENKRLIKSKTSELYHFFERYGISNIDDEAMQLLEFRITNDLTEKTNLSKERKRMVVILNGVTWRIMKRIKDSMEK